MMVGWFATRFDRTKDIKSLEHWLTPKKAKNQSPEEGQKSLRGMIARMKAKKEQTDGDE